MTDLFVLLGQTLGMGALAFLLYMGLVCCVNAYRARQNGES